jgi:hypothetical protein
MKLFQPFRVSSLLTFIAIFVAFIGPALCEEAAVSVDKDSALTQLKNKVSEITSNPSTRRYIGGALLGSAIATAAQPFKNAKDHFLV